MQRGFLLLAQKIKRVKNQPKKEIFVRFLGILGQKKAKTAFF
jgi:hypothetical protein